MKSKTKTPGKAPVTPLSTGKELAAAKLHGEIKRTISEFLAEIVLDEHDAARVLLTLLASLRVELGGTTGIEPLDAVLLEIGERAGMVPLQDQPLQ